MRELQRSAAETALEIQLRLQQERSYRPYKHFKLTADEFKYLHWKWEGLTRTATVGWWEYRGIPVWVDQQA